jgi:hypothetical protein
VSRLVQEISDFGFGIIAATLLAMAFRLSAYPEMGLSHPRVRVVHLPDDSQAAA